MLTQPVPFMTFNPSESYGDCETLIFAKVCLQLYQEDVDEEDVEEDVEEGEEFAEHELGRPAVVGVDALDEVPGQ